jgi:hypothetical protein
MNGLICLTKADADAFAAAVDSSLGFPRDGVPIGPGPHVAPAKCRDVHYSTPTKHPTLPQWAVPFDGTVSGIPVAKPIGAIVQALDATWGLVGAVAPVVATVVDVVPVP